MTDLNDRELAVLRTLADTGETTVDDFVATSELYVNSWAPTFTRLRQRGLVARTGERATTRHGAQAHVIRITEAGRAALKGLEVPA